MCKYVCASWENKFNTSLTWNHLETEDYEYYMQLGTPKIKIDMLVMVEIMKWNINKINHSHCWETAKNRFIRQEKVSQR